MAFQLDALAEAIGEDMLSPFGQMLTELCARQKVTKVELAQAVEPLAMKKRGKPLSSGYMTDCVRDPKHHPRAYAPDPDFLPIWADILGLEEDGEERARFMELGLQAKLKESLARKQFDNMKSALKAKDAENEALREKLERLSVATLRLGTCTDQVIRMLREHGVSIPKPLAQELKAVEKEIGADL